MDTGAAGHVMLAEMFPRVELDRTSTAKKNRCSKWSPFSTPLMMQRDHRWAQSAKNSSTSRRIVAADSPRTQRAASDGGRSGPAVRC